MPEGVRQTDGGQQDQDQQQMQQQYDGDDGQAYADGQDGNPEDAEAESYVQELMEKASAVS